MSTSENYRKLDEGMGGAYERIAYSNMIKRIAKEYDCKSVLELDATYIAGIPAFNSCIIAQDKFDTHIAVQKRDLADAQKVWSMTGLKDKVHIYEIESSAKTPFKDNQFDLVWNHLAFEQYKNPDLFVAEMKRISKKVVINLTLNPFNYGYWIHFINHALRKERWNHGKPYNATIRAIKKAHLKRGLEVVEIGALDTPPWMDTVNAVIGNSMTYADVLPGKAREAWTWCSCNPDCQKHWLVKLFLNWENQMPFWFKILASHHLYVASIKS